MVNVRLKVCSMYPILKSQLRLPGDRLLLQTLEQNARELMALETDRDISNSIRMVCMHNFYVHNYAYIYLFTLWHRICLLFGTDL